MRLRSITQLIGPRRDQDHDQAASLCGTLGRFCRSIQRRAAKVPATTGLHKVWPATDEALASYLDALPEPQRQMLAAWHNGMRTSEIAKNMNMHPDDIRKSLVEIYSSVRLLIFK